MRSVRPVVRQQIFDSVLKVVGDAREYLVVDFFLFNSQRGALIDVKPQRELAIELRDALLARKRAMPEHPHPGALRPHQ